MNEVRITEACRASLDRPVRAAAVALAILSLAFLCGCSKGASDAGQGSAATVDSHTVRIVRSKQLTSLAVLEKTGSLATRLKQEGFDVQWLEFAAGPQQLEALNAGSLDIALTAESPPIFALAAGAPLVYLLTTAPSGRAVSLLVAKDSTAKSMADLKGKKVACQKASIGHYLLVRALEDVGLSAHDVEWVFLPPPDASAAFSQNEVDAWFIWEPYVARSLEKGVGRVLLDGERLKDSGSFYTTRRAFAQAHPKVIRAFVEALEGAETWSRDHPHEMAELLSPAIQIEVPILERMHDEYTFELFRMSDAVTANQQRIADMWFKLGSLPVRVNVADGLLSREEYLALVPASIPEVPEGASR
ncbi:MAG TPA: aliphatic sulfonate ABC transporter substrate-binding protein [Polyangiaceae bacterium]|nr:aliphatic sulfonate ABC transporter substrate-binding protein [Polyangiaceae bacterium]